MKRVILGSVVVASVVAHAQAVVGEPEITRLTALGQRFVDSLRDDNVVAYAQCWAPGPIVCEVAASVDRLTEKQVSDMKAYYLKRDRNIAAFFRALRDELEKLAGDCTRLCLDSVLSKDLREHRTKHGNTVRTLGQVIVTIRIDANTLVRLDMNNGAKIGDEWYFSDNPRTRIKVVKIKKGEEAEPRAIRLDVKAAAGTAHSGAVGRDRNDPRKMILLGVQFVQSLKDDNIVGFSQCWAPSPLLCELAVGVDGATEEEVVKMKAYYLKRDRKIPAFFKALRDQLEELAGDRSRISYEAITRVGGETLRDEPRVVTADSMYVRIRVNAKTVVEIRINKGGLMFADVWYFSGTPEPSITVIEEDKEENNKDRAKTLQLKMAELP